MNIELNKDEINALNKLLGRVKFESHLDADELDSFSNSPFIISAFEKIHTIHMDNLRGKLSIVTHETNDFKLSEENGIKDIIERIQTLGKDRKDYLKKLDDAEVENTCKNLFAPFIPTDEQRKKVISEIIALRNE